MICWHEGCRKKTMFALCNEHSWQRVLGPMSEKYPRKIWDTLKVWEKTEPPSSFADAEEKLREKESFEAKWGWLANLVSGSVILGFQVLNALFRTIHQILRTGPEATIPVAISLAVIMLMLL